MGGRAAKERGHRSDFPPIQISDATETGAGKSTIAPSFAATVTRGGQWPDGVPVGVPQRAVYWNGEDGVQDTLLPRFMAAGGDRTNMQFVWGIRQEGKSDHSIRQSTSVL
jgi:AAA domain